jgi:hypothetical protein
MATTVFESNKKESDLVKGEYDERICRDEYTFLNNTGATADFEIGQTLITSGENKVIAPAGDCDSVLVTPVKALANNGTQKIGAIKGGPCILDQDQLVFAAGVDATEAGTQRADLVALGITLKREPLKQGGPDDVLE